MVKRSFNELLNDLVQRRTAGDDPPVVLLGAGASVDAGLASMDGLFKLASCQNFQEFSEYIRTRNSSERYRLLARYLQTENPAAVTPGYTALAGLCAALLFDVVLTTNLDPLLDDALSAAQLKRKDYLLLVNGVLRPDRFDLLLTPRIPRVKIIKLHGDLFHRFMAWTPEEMNSYLDDIFPQLAAAVRHRDILVAGHSLRDERIRDLVMSTTGTIWYTHPKEVAPHLAPAFENNERVRVVLSAECAFERLFPAIASALGISAGSPSASLLQNEVKRKPFREPERNIVETMDDLMGATVGLAGPGDQLAMTGFLLAEPRIIVTDGYLENIKALGNKAVRVLSSRGEWFTAKKLSRGDHPFGPLILKPEKRLNLPGLRLDPRPLSINERIHVAVAAGERIGLSSGKVSSARSQSLEVAPLGRVGRLIQLECFVRPGSSGAPVVDDSMAVRGFVVAGSTDPARPVTYALPASFWGSSLE